MSPWRAWLLGTYYYGLYPQRWWRNRAARRAGNVPVVVLFYHRICDDLANEWTCSNAMFIRQMRWLQKNFEMISLAEAQARIRSGKNHRPAVSITFDDGYQCNCQRALPYLIQERIPCTYFVSNRPVFDGVPFPHDLKLGNRFPANTLAELKGLAAAGIEIGAHTRTHADLGKVTDPAQLLDEVVVAGEELQSAIGHHVRYFAFPYGQHQNLNASAFQLAYDAGYEGVCSAYGGFNYPGGDAFHLQRIHVENNLIRVKNWTTIDPRKEGQPRFQYESAHHPPVPPVTSTHRGS